MFLKSGSEEARNKSCTIFQLAIQFCIVCIIAFPGPVDWHRKVTIGHRGFVHLQMQGFVHSVMFANRILKVH